ncbi:MAG: PKD domain-containing protein, partial [Candidatus Helarchaeota archaeon]
MRKILGCFFFIMIIITFQIFATTYYVDATNGNDSNPGTESLPWRTIQKAADIMAKGDKVIVNDGTYSERVIINTSGSSDSLIIFQINSDNIVNCYGFTIFGDYIRVDGFRIDSSSIKTCSWSASDYGIAVYGNHCEIVNNYITGGGFGGLRLYSSSNNCVIANNEFYQNGLVGIQVEGANHRIEYNEIYDIRCAPCGWNDANGVTFFGSNHTFIGNYIHDITFANNLGFTPHIDGFQTFNDTYNTGARNCIFEKNHVSLMEEAKDGVSTVYSFMLNDSSNITIKNNLLESWGGINTGGGGNSRLYIYNNTFRSNLDFSDTNWPRAVGLDNVSIAEVYNNITVDYSWAHYHISGGSNINYDYNCIWNSDGSNPSLDGYTIQPHDIYATDPKFINEFNNLHLQSSSPCINNGITLSQVDNDYDGNTRPQGIKYDIGAYEYISNNPLSAEINVSPNSGYVPLSVNFSGNASGGTSPYSYSWDFGDGNTSSSQNPSHTYSTAGTYTVT